MAFDFSLNPYRSNVVNIARPYLFYLQIPPLNKVDKKLTYLVRSTTVPSRTISDIPTNWQGYTYHWGGVSTGDDWSCTILLDHEMYGYKAFIDGMNKIHKPDTNKHGDPNTYEAKDNLKLFQLRHDGDPSANELFTGTLHYAGPQTTAGYEMNYGSTDSPGEFQVTFKYVFATFVAGSN